jgi:Gas vesicle synthesis protein GvpL/GvpF
VIDLYAITDDPAPPLPDVARLSAVASHGLAVVCAPAEEGEITADVLWRHEEVVEALMEDRDLLPVRFGTRVDDETAAARALGERHQELASALDRVRGAVELSLRVVGERPASQPPAGEASSGAEYLRARGRSVAAHEEVVRTIHRPLSKDARASTELPAREPSSELLRAAYLVDRGRTRAFVDHVTCLQAAHPRLRLLCTGPWPPYSFTQP